MKSNLFKKDQLGYTAVGSCEQARENTCFVAKLPLAITVWAKADNVWLVSTGLLASDARCGD